MVDSAADHPSADRLLRVVPVARSALVVGGAIPLLLVFRSATASTRAEAFFALYLIAWNLSPVLVGILLAAWSRRTWPALGWLAGFVGAQWWAYYTVVIAPRASTSALVYLFLPAYVALGFGPVGLLIGHVLVSRWGRARARA